MQNRKYSSVKVRNGAIELDPETLLDPGHVGESGRPVVTRWDGKLLVLSGNHRVNMIRQAMREYPHNAAKYLEMLKQEGQGFGVDREMAGAQDVLVREIPTPASIEELQRIVADLNEPRVQTFSKTTDMANRAVKVSASTMELVSRAMDRAGEGGTIKAVLDGTDGADLIRSLVADRVIPDTEMPGFVRDDGSLTPEGKTAVEGAITGKILGGTTVETGVLNKLMTAAGTIVRAQEAAPDLKLVEKIRAAVQLINDAGGKPVDQYLSQGVLKPGMDPNAPPESTRPPRPAEDIVRLANDLNKLGPVVFKNNVLANVERLNKPAGLFGSERVPEYQSPQPKGFKKTKTGIEVRDLETGKWRPYDEAKDGPVSELKDSGSDEGWADDERQDWAGPGKTEAPKAPPRRPSQPPGDIAGPGAKKYEIDYQSEENITPDETSGHREVYGAKVLSPIDGYSRRTGATAVHAEAVIGGEKLDARAFDHMGGEETLSKLADMIERHEGDGLMFSRLVRGEAMTPGDKVIYDKAPKEFDHAAKEWRNFRDMVRAHDVPLREAAEAKIAEAEELESSNPRRAELLAEAEELESQRYAIGDQGPNYFAWRGLTWDHVVKLAERYGAERVSKGLRFGNLDFSREGFKEPSSNSMETAMNYVRQIHQKATAVIAQKKILAAQEMAKSRGWHTASEIFGDINKYLIEKQKTWMDEAAFTKEIEKMVKSSKEGGQYFKRFKDVAADRSPASRVVGWTNSIASALAVAFNIGSGVKATVSNTWRVGSEIGLKRAWKASVDSMDYFAAEMKAKLSGEPLSKEMLERRRTYERVAGLDESSMEEITGVEKGFEWGGKMLERVRKAGYSMVRLPDVVAKVIAAEDALRSMREKNPGWSEQRVETNAAIRVAEMADVTKDWARAPIASNPLYKLGMLFSQSGVREITQVIRQFNEGPKGWAKLATQFGGRVATWALLYKMMSGEVDRDRLIQAISGMLPLSFFWQNKAPPLGIIPQKIIQVGSAAHVAVTGRDVGGKKQLSSDQRTDRYLKAAPAAFGQRSFRAMLERKKK